MEKYLEKLAFEWVKNNPTDAEGNFYCQTRDVFQSRLDKMIKNLLDNKNIQENDVYIISAMTGEIGNNSFDHNLGKWTDIPGIFFAYDIADGKLKIVLADRGQGILATLKKVKPDLENDMQALETAFTERISGRAPESRGNGLKFVKENLSTGKMHLMFVSGDARAQLNEKMKIEKSDEKIKGCLAILTV